MKMDDGISKKKQERIKEKIAQLKEDQEIKAVQEIIEFDKTPSDLKADMDRFVIGQEEGKKIMCTAIAFHYRRLSQALKKGMTDSGGDIDIALRDASTRLDRAKRFLPETTQTYSTDYSKGRFSLKINKKNHFAWSLDTLYRYDQLMTLGWKILIPLGVANVLISGLFLI